MKKVATDCCEKQIFSYFYKTQNIRRFTMKKVAVLLCVMICALPLHVQGNDYHSTFVSNQP